MEDAVTRIPYDEAYVEAIHLPKEISDLLLVEGLPQFRDKGNDLLGVHFRSMPERDLIQVQHEGGFITLLPIGYEWEETAALLGVETGTGAVYSVDALSGEHGLINTSLLRFLEFLQRYAQFIENFSEVLEPSVMTLEEAQAKLAAFQRGELISGKKKVHGSGRKEAISELRAFFAEQDPGSLSNEKSWWSLVLEQLEDGLL
ncbi:SUKH-4 family immunity protein [Paenibacillus xylanilyticus]|uniref:SUKH-4 family immunity protein n=1 Tax=Paenibacillus xylanilyticus TaxID=248903 RepID=UPI003AAD780C